MGLKIFGFCFAFINSLTNICRAHLCSCAAVLLAFKTPQRQISFGSCDVGRLHTVGAREAHFEVKMYKTPQRQTTFGSCDVETMYAVVVQSTFEVKMFKHQGFADNFWMLRCRSASQVQGIVDLLECEQNVRVL